MLGDTAGKLGGDEALRDHVGREVVKSVKSEFDQRSRLRQEREVVVKMVDSHRLKMAELNSSSEMSLALLCEHANGNFNRTPPEAPAALAGAACQTCPLRACLYDGGHHAPSAPAPTMQGAR